MFGFKRERGIKFWFSFTFQHTLTFLALQPKQATDIRFLFAGVSSGSAFSFVAEAFEEVLLDCFDLLGLFDEFAEESVDGGC